MTDRKYFTEYANQYNCSLAAAIYDRDEPMSLEQCVKAFRSESGREPTSNEVHEMHPDNMRCIEQRVSELHAEMSDWR